MKKFSINYSVKGLMTMFPLFAKVEAEKEEDITIEMVQQAIIEQDSFCKTVDDIEKIYI